MAASENGLEHANGNRGQQRADEQIGGNHEEDPGLTDAAQVHQRDYGQNANTDYNRVRLKTRDGRDKGAYSGGNSHGHDENVVNHQRSCGEQAGKRAQIFRGHGVGTASARIRRDGLTIGEVHDGQQHDDAEADGNDIGNSRGAERDQKRESRLGPVRGRTERVQAEDGNAR